MKNLTLNDDTQHEVLRHLGTTELLLAQVASRLSGRECGAEIYALPDLGFPSNVRRVHGGFFTGACYTWQTDVPFVPIDATVNCCGVSLWRLRGEIPSHDDFRRRIAEARQAMQETEYVWNYETGNHFITYGSITGSEFIPDGNYLVMHSSAAEFKKQGHGLYPMPGNWYAGEVQVHRGPDRRYLRYITGKAAERFIMVARQLERYNCDRHRWLAEYLAGARGISSEVLNVQHYGMPHANAVAIGCQWEYKPYMLLTGPELPLYLVNPVQGGANATGELHLTPNGLGMRAAAGTSITYAQDGIEVGCTSYGFDQPMKGAVGMELRRFHQPSPGEVPQEVKRVLDICPGEILATFQPIFSNR